MDEATGDAKWTPPWEQVLAWIESELGRAMRRYRLPPDERDEMRQQITMRIVDAIRRFDPSSGRARLECQFGEVVASRR